MQPSSFCCWLCLTISNSLLMLSSHLFVLCSTLLCFSSWLIPLCSVSSCCGWMMLFASLTTSQYLILFHFQVPHAVCVIGCYVYIFRGKRSLTPQLIAPLIRTSCSHSLCWFKQSCLDVLACAPVLSSHYVWAEMSQAAMQWVGLCGCYVGIMMTKSHLSELSLRMSFHPEWVIRSAVCEWEGCRIKGFSNFLMSSILFVEAEKAGKLTWGI